MEQIKARNISLDFFKGILVIQMVFAHSLQFFVDLYNDQNQVALLISNYVNLVTFSGFVFSFGYVSYHAYLGKEFKVAARKIAANMGKLMLAFYISSFAFVIFREEAIFNPNTIWDLLLIRRLAGWSEFLFSFVCLMFLCLVLFPILKKLNKVSAIILAVISLGMCFIPYTHVNPILGSFIGGTNFAYFSVVQYFVLFVCGIIFAKHKIVFNKWIGLVALLGTVAYLGHLLIFGRPSRFPVSALWIAGSAGFLYAYYLLVQVLPLNGKTQWLARIGSISLYYLVLSNLLIFAIRSTRFYRLGMPTAIVVFFIVMVVCWYLDNLTIKAKCYASKS